MKMGYAVVGFGPSELKLDLLPIVLNLDRRDESAGFGQRGARRFQSGLSKLYKIVEASAECGLASRRYSARRKWRRKGTGGLSRC